MYDSNNTKVNSAYLTNKYNNVNNDNDNNDKQG